MFVYLFVWETLGIPETPEGDHRETRDTTAGEKETKSGLVHAGI